MSKSIIHADKDIFGKEVLSTEMPVLVDFWAEWCPPCKMIAPVLDQLAEEYAGKVKVVKVDVDKNPELASLFGVRNIPTLITFKAGEMAERTAGAMPKSELEKLLKNVL